MSDDLKSKTKTSKQIFQMWNEQCDHTEWIPLVDVEVLLKAKDAEHFKNLSIRCEKCTWKTDVEKLEGKLEAIHTRLHEWRKELNPEEDATTYQLIEEVENIFCSEKLKGETIK